MILCTLLHEDFGNFQFSCNQIGVLNTNLNNINLDNSFDEDDCDTIILTRLLASHNKFQYRKALKKR